MASLRLAVQSALEQSALPARHGRPGDAGLVVAQRTGYALATVIARQAVQSRLAARVAEAFGCELPQQPRRAEAKTTAFSWAGPGRWLVSDKAIEPQLFEARLRSELADLALISDQSDGLVIIGVRGPKARETLAKGLPVDLHPRCFAAPQVAITLAAHIGVTIWQLDAAPTYELAVMRSYAASFWDWLVDAAAEFGLLIESDDDWMASIAAGRQHSSRASP